MATYTSDYATDYLVPLFSDSGNVFCVFGTYDATTSIGAGDVIELVKIPGGANLLPCYAVVGAGDWKIGTDSDDDLLGTSVTADGWIAPSAVGEVGDAGDEVVVQATANSALTASGTVGVYVFYTMTNIKD